MTVASPGIVFSRHCTPGAGLGAAELGCRSGAAGAARRLRRGGAEVSTPPSTTCCKSVYSNKSEEELKSNTYQNLSSRIGQFWNIRKVLRTWVEPQCRVRGRGPLGGLIQNRIARSKHVCFSRVREAECLRDPQSQYHFQLSLVFRSRGRGYKGGPQDPPENDLVTLGATRKFRSPAARI